MIQLNLYLLDYQLARDCTKPISVTNLHLRIPLFQISTAVYQFPRGEAFGQKT